MSNVKFSWVGTKVIVNVGGLIPQLKRSCSFPFELFMRFDNASLE